jgi:hypothetical protein
MTVAQPDLFGGETSAPAVPDGPRFAYSCGRCAEWFYCAEDLADDYGRARVDCPICAGPVSRRGRVQDGAAVADVIAPACDDRCTGARGTCCECKCGGRNHGTHRWVKVTVDLGGRPRFELTGTLAALAAKRLPEIERAEQLAAGLVAQLEDTYRAELAARRAGQWLEPDAFRRLLRWKEHRRAIRKAERLKVPANRVRRLQEIGARINEQT